MRLEATLYPGENDPGLLAVESNDTYKHFGLFTLTDVLAGPPGALGLGRALLKEIHNQLSVYYHNETDFSESLRFHLQRLHKALRARLGQEKLVAALAAVVVQGDRVTLCTTRGVGVYLLRGHHLKLLNTGSVQKNRGLEAATGPEYLGLADTLELNLRHARLKPGDELILCNVDLLPRLGKGELLKKLSHTTEQETIEIMGKVLTQPGEQAMVIRTVAASLERARGRLVAMAAAALVVFGLVLAREVTRRPTGVDQPPAAEEQSQGGALSAAIQGMKAFITTGTEGGGFSAKMVSKELGVPYDVIPLEDGTLLIADDKVNGLVKVDVDGTTKELESDIPVVFPVSLDLVEIEVYLVDFDRQANHVVVLDQEGRKLREITPPGKGYQFPKAITHDAGRNLFVADRMNNRILKFNNNGDLVEEWTLPPGLHHPNGLAVTGDGTVFFSSRADNTIGILQPGERPKALKLFTEDEQEVVLDQPSDLVLTKSNLLVIVDANNSRLLVSDLKGRVQQVLGPTGPNVIPDIDLFPPKGLGMDDEGNLYLVGANKISYDAAQDQDTKGVVWKITL